jgi:RNA polymerase sigma-70 factor (ECF subfamily)
VDEPSVNLIARWRRGDETAATELFQRYAERLLSLAHRHLSSRLGQRVDAEDIVQSVCQSFFTGARDGRYVLDRSGDLWRLLVAITLHKLNDKYRRHTADKRSLTREQTLHAEDSRFGLSIQAAANEPSPEEAVTLADLVEHVMRTLDPVERRILELRLQGNSMEEIVAVTNRCRHTVRRVLRDVRQHLEEWYPEVAAQFE